MSSAECPHHIMAGLPAPGAGAVMATTSGSSVPAAGRRCAAPHSGSCRSGGTLGATELAWCGFLAPVADGGSHWCGAGVNDCYTSGELGTSIFLIC